MISFFYKKRILFLFLLVLLFQPSNWTFFALRLSDFILILTFLVQYLFPFQKNNNFKVKNQFFKYFGLYFVVILFFSIIFLYLSGFSLQITSFFYLYYFLRFYLIFSICEKIISYNDINIKQFLNFQIYLSMILIFISFIQYFNIPPFDSILYNLYIEDLSFYQYNKLFDLNRVIGIIGNTNGFSILMATAMPIILFRYLNSKMIKKIFYLLFLFFIMLTVLIFTSSRTGLLSLIFSFLFIFNFTPNRSKFLNYISSLLVFLFSGIIIANYIDISEFINFRLIGIFTLFEESYDSMIMARYYFWTQQLDTFDFIVYPFKILFGLSYRMNDLNYADNGLLCSYFNSGLVGVFLRLYFYFQSIFLLIRLRLEALKDVRLMNSLILLVSAFSMLFFEVSSELFEYYKLSQYFYVLLSLSIINYYKVKASYD